MSKKEKDKERKKDKQQKILKDIKIAANCKSKCCDKYTKSEKKRCARCPMFDLIKKAS